MKCSNPACNSDKFLVQVEHRLIEQPDRLPVKLTCAHCKKPVKAYITNEQMKEISKLLRTLSDNQARMPTIIVTQPKKPWWKFW